MTEIRQATQEDVDELFDISADVDRVVNMLPSEIEEIVKVGNSYVAEDNGEVVATLIQGDAWYLTTLWVSDEYREEDLESKILERAGYPRGHTFADNEATIQLMEKNGYHRVDTFTRENGDVIYIYDQDETESRGPPDDWSVNSRRDPRGSPLFSPDEVDEE